MDKRYQVFVSSTFADLQDERKAVIQALMEMDCIPAGMELFPAVDEAQWEFIKRVIDDCDYYVVIVGGRYGSLTEEGISFTEKEYEYAISIGLKVLAFVHQQPEQISVGKSDLDPSLRKKLEEFRRNLLTGRLVKFWTAANELPGLVALSLSKTIKVYPAVGWIRAKGAPSAELLGEINDLRKENEGLRREISKHDHQNIAEELNLAGLDEPFDLGWSFTTSGAHPYKKSVRVTATWEEIFTCLSPRLVEHPNDTLANHMLAQALYRIKEPGYTVPHSIEIDRADFDTIRLQLTTLGLVEVKRGPTVSGNMGLFWTLKAKGQQLMLQLRLVKSQKQ